MTPRKAEWVSLAVTVWMILSSTLGQDVGYPDRSPSLFYSVPAGKCRDNTSISHYRFFQNILQIIFHQQPFDAVKSRYLQHHELIYKKIPLSTSFPFRIITLFFHIMIYTVIIVLLSLPNKCKT